ncbi:MAG: VWA domain-containing protein [Acidobacteria bacterium]|nr:VWA domain-containing protein [Acidobacteriota bacterium]
MPQQSSSALRVVILFLAVCTATRGLDQNQAAGDAKSNSAAPPASQLPKFSSRTDLVMVPVIVHDRNGAHVQGLGKDDFIVEENGAVQKTAVFEEITTAGDTRMKRASAPGVYANTLQASSIVAPRINIVVLDAINTAFTDQAYARRHLIDFLQKSAERHEMTSLLSLTRDGLKVVHDFTADSGVLIAALRKVRGSIDMMSGENTDALITGADAAAVTSEAGDIQSFLEASSARMMQQFAIQNTIDGFTAIAESFRGLPGRKALIWVTGSFPFQMTSPNDPPSARDFNQELWRAFQLLNDANIAVYPIDARGLVVALPEASTRLGSTNIRTLAPARLSNQAATIETMQSFAVATGGKAYFNSNDLEKAFEHASDDSSSYYLLGYYRQPGDNKPGWRRLKVKVTKPGLSVRTRSGYFVNAQDKEPPSGPSEEVKIALRAPMDFTGIPLAVRWEPPGPDNAGKRPVRFDLSIAHEGLVMDANDQNHMRFEIIAVARRASGESAATFSKTVDAHPSAQTLAKIDQGGVTYRDQMQLPPGEYSVRFVIRDLLGGRVGSVLAPLKIE